MEPNTFFISDADSLKDKTLAEMEAFSAIPETNANWQLTSISLPEIITPIVSPADTVSIHTNQPVQHFDLNDYDLFFAGDLEAEELMLEFDNEYITKDNTLQIDAKIIQNEQIIEEEFTEKIVQDVNEADLNAVAIQSNSISFIEDKVIENQVEVTENTSLFDAITPEETVILSPILDLTEQNELVEFEEGKSEEEIVNLVEQEAENEDNTNYSPKESETEILDENIVSVTVENEDLIAATEEETVMLSEEDTSLLLQQLQITEVENENIEEEALILPILEVEEHNKEDYLEETNRLETEEAQNATFYDNQNMLIYRKGNQVVQVPVTEEELQQYFDTSRVQRKTNTSDDKKLKTVDLLENFLEKQPKMPKLNPNEDSKPIDIQKVDTPEPEILTETMAKLHVLQGNKKEAIEIYEKLSLVFPEKSAYFADQIQKINK